MAIAEDTLAAAQKEMNGFGGDGGDDETDDAAAAGITGFSGFKSGLLRSTAAAASTQVSCLSSGIESLNLEERAHLTAILGPGHEVVSVEKEVVVRSDEVFMVNGTAIALEGEEGERIKACLLSGTIPNQDLINHLLLKAGLFLRPVRQVVSAEITVSSVDRKCESTVVKKMSASSPEKILSQGFLVTEEVNTSYDSKAIEVSNEHSAFRPKSPAIQSIKPEADFYVHLEHFVDGTEGFQCQDFQYALLLWSRLFATPANMLTKVSTKAEAILKSDKDQSQHLYTILSRWITWFPEDFGDEATMQKLRKIFQLFSDSPAITSAKSMQLLSTLATHLAAIRKHEHFLADLVITKKDSSCLHLSTVEAAQELARIELEYLSFLGPAEFINVFAREATAKSSSCEMPPQVIDARLRSSTKTRNFDAYIQWFNHLSFLVATSVCKTKRKKERANVIEYWIEVARMCVNLGNFNSLMGIITGLNMFPVARLQKTWRRVQSGKFSVLEHQMDPTSNFLSYRSTLTAAVIRSESATDDRQRIIIPFFSLFVKDLYTAKEEFTISGTKFDISSMLSMSKSIHEFSKWKEVNCPFERDFAFSQYLLQSVCDEENLDLESFGCEVPRTHSERDRYKYLKSKLKTHS